MNIVHLLKYVVKCTVTDYPFSTQANCSKCPPSAWIHFLKHRSVVDASCRAENSLQQFLSHVHLVCAHTVAFM